MLGKNPGVTSLVLVWWLCLIAKEIIISSKIGRGRKDSAVSGSRGGEEVLRAEPQARPLGPCAASGLCSGHLPRGGDGGEGEWGGMGGGVAQLGQGGAAGLGEISSAHRQACALGASSRLEEAFIPGSERPAADCGAGE